MLTAFTHHIPNPLRNTDKECGNCASNVYTIRIHWQQQAWSRMSSYGLLKRDNQTPRWIFSWWKGPLFMVMVDMGKGFLAAWEMWCLLQVALLYFIWIEMLCWYWKHGAASSSGFNHVFDLLYACYFLVGSLWETYLFSPLNRSIIYSIRLDWLRDVVQFAPRRLVLKRQTRG